MRGLQNLEKKQTIFVTLLSKGPSINHVSSEGEGGGPTSKLMKGDENRYVPCFEQSRCIKFYTSQNTMKANESRYFAFNKADLVFEYPQKL